MPQGTTSDSMVDGVTKGWNHIGMLHSKQVSLPQTHMPGIRGSLVPPRHAPHTHIPQPALHVHLPHTLSIQVTLLVLCIIITPMMNYIINHSISLHPTRCTKHSMQLARILPYTCTKTQMSPCTLVTPLCNLLTHITHLIRRLGMCLFVQETPWTPT